LSIRDILIAKALSEVIARFGPPGDLLRLPLRSNQYWITAFSRPTVTSEQMRTYLTSFQSIRASWDYGRAADLTNQIIQQQAFDPLVDVDRFASTLRTETERRASQCIAASSIIMLAKLDASLFVVGEMALLSASIANWCHSDRSERLNLKTSFRRVSTDRCGDGLIDYPAYARACDAYFACALEWDAFRQAAQRFSEYLTSVAGPLRVGTPQNFVERRLFESLLACEGWYISYWSEFPDSVGKLAPLDQNIVSSKMEGSLKPQDVFAVDVAARFGF
jgi:hypothetical protein